jgi:signal transduction histidine kinase
MIYPFVRIPWKTRNGRPPTESWNRGRQRQSRSNGPRVVGEVVAGLLKNAIENTPDGGSSGKVRRQENQVWIRQDSGVGITEENQRYIFDGLFTRRKQSCMRPGTLMTSGRGKGLTFSE